MLAVRDEDEPDAAFTLLVDELSGEAMRIGFSIGPSTPGVPTVALATTTAAVEGSSRTGPRIEVSTELAGRRVMWVYSENDVYEHIYLNTEWYVWHCLKGDEYPLADTGPCTVYKVRENIFLLVFSENVVTMGASMVLDFAALRSYCAAFGTTEGGAPQLFTFGAFGRILSHTDYPDPLVV